MAAVQQKSMEGMTPKPVYAVFGPDDFLRSQRVEQLKNLLLGADHDGTSISEYEGGSAELACILDDCRTPSLLSPTRVVCVRDADELVSAKGAQDKRQRVRKGKEPTNREILEKYVQSPCPTGILILICRSWPKNTRLYKLVDALGGNIACNPPGDARGLASWSMTHARETYGCTLLPASAERLVELVGDEMGLLNMELSKLATFVGPGADIKVEDVEELVGSSRSEKVFGITDAIAQGNAKRALDLWQQVLATDRSAPFRSIMGLAFGFRRLAEAKRLLNDGVALTEVRSRVRFFGATASLQRQLDRFSVQEWEDHLTRLVDMDHASKTGLGEVATSVEKLIVELCAAA